jgi:hypothetical protein
MPGERRSWGEGIPHLPHMPTPTCVAILTYVRFIKSIKLPQGAKTSLFRGTPKFSPRYQRSIATNRASMPQECPIEVPDP